MRKSNPYRKKSYFSKPVSRTRQLATSRVMKCKRMINYARLSASGAAEVDMSYVFQLADLPAYTEFTNLFDEFRIDKIKVEFFPDTQDCTPASGTGNTVVYTAVDYDDANTVAISGLQQYDNCVAHNGLKPFSRTLVPRIAKGTLVIAGTFSGASSENCWVDAASPTIEWFGLKIGIPLQAGNANTWTPVATFWMSFRNTR